MTLAGELNAILAVFGAPKHIRCAWDSRCEKDFVC